MDFHFFHYELRLQGDHNTNEAMNVEFKNEPKDSNVPSYKSGEIDKKMIDQLPQLEEIGTIILFFIESCLMTMFVECVRLWI